MRFLNTTNSYAFRRIFGNEQHQEVLISFLNSVLDFNDEHEKAAYGTSTRRPRRSRAQPTLSSLSAQLTASS